MPDYIPTILKIVLAILALLGSKEAASKVTFWFQKNSKKINVSGSSGETVGRDKIVNNHFNFLGVGKPSKLLNQISVPAAITPTGTSDLITQSLGVLVIADATLTITASEVENITQFFQNVFDENSNGRRSQSLMKGAMFALISEKDNIEWREHCASSLREYFQGWDGDAGKISGAFNAIKKTGDSTFPNMGNNRDLYIKMQWYYRYFSAKRHHEHDNAVRALCQLHSNQDLKEDTPDLFKKTVAMFLTDMSGFVKLIKT